MKSGLSLALAAILAGCAYHNAAEVRTPVADSSSLAAAQLSQGAAASDAAVMAANADLVLAARYGQLARVRQLLDQGVDINTRDALGRTALIVAAAESDTDVVSLLLERGADIALRDNDGSDALTAAVIKGRSQNVIRLLDAGAALEARGPQGETALMAAIRAGESTIVNLLLLRGADPGTQSQEEFVSAGNLAYTPLMYTARYGRGSDGLLMMRQLVRYGANSHLYRPNGETALTLAQRYGQEEMVEDLRALGVRDESPYAKLDVGGQLLQAVRLDDFNKAQELIAAGASVNYRDALTGMTPLAGVAWYGRDDMLDLMLGNGARVNDVPWGQREERIAVSSVPVAQRDLMRAMARGDTALISAIRRSDEAMVKRLLDAGAGLMVPNREGDTPALVAVRIGQPRLLELLLDRGLDPDVTSFPMRVDYLLTRFSGGKHLMPLLVEAAAEGNEEMVALLLRAGAASSIRDDSGRTALHAAAAGGYVGLTRLLLANGARPEVLSADGESALDIARRLGKEDVAALLSGQSG
ncbi:MAG: ankyrin repeat domain-containing protein [Chromatiales bacterium]|nr:ankyrin repeat domain-containing protein [Chromatiales bacterium]